MLETRAIIVQVNGKYALVQGSQTNSCEQCSGKGCGARTLSQLFCRKSRQYQVANPISANVGDEVVISVADGALLRGIGLVYLLPLLLLVMGAMLGGVLVEQPGQRDGFTAVGAIFGLVAGFIIAKWISLRQAGSYFQPFIARPWRGE
jgi:sigma-E factor negative regulatory protein RseC